MSDHIYELSLLNAEVGQDLYITLVPISGHVVLGVNPEVIPNQIEQSRYFNDKKLTKTIRIKADDLSNEMGKINKIFIFVSPQGLSTYYIRAEFQEGTPLLKPNQPLVGAIKNRDIAQYRLKLVSSNPTEDKKFSIKIHTEIKSGEIDIYSMDCKNMKSCSIPYIAVTDPQYAAKNSIQVNAERTNSKSITFEKSCGPSFSNV